MTALEWDKDGERLYETGVSKGVLYPRSAQGEYNVGVAWNGLTAVTESPSGAEPTPMYADNIKYLNLISVEEFGGTIEAYMYPEAFAACDGTATPSAGIAIGQQTRRIFGLSYRTLIGNDSLATDYGYKLHLVYGALAAPSERAYATVNDTPEGITFSWEFSTTAVNVPNLRPTSILTIDSTKVAPAKLAAIETILYGAAGVDPRLPLPSEVLAIVAGSVTAVTAAAPTYNATTKVITIPTVTGLVYQIDGKTVSGTVTITKNTVVTAKTQPGYTFAENTDDDWAFSYA